MKGEKMAKNTIAPVISTRRLKQTISVSILTLGVLLACRASADWAVTYCAPGQGLNCGFFPDGSYLFLLSSDGIVQTYYHQTNWIYQGPYGATTTPLPSSLPTITLSGAGAQAIAAPVSATWRVTWYGTADDVASALNALASDAQTRAKVIVTGNGKRTQFGLVHP